MWIYQLLKLVGWILLALVIVFLLIAPAAFSLLVPITGYSQQLFRWLHPVEIVQRILIHLLAMGWMFFLGGCLASFLNVVAWRSSSWQIDYGIKSLSCLRQSIEVS